MGGLVRGLPVVGWHLTTAVAGCRVQTFYRGQAARARLHATVCFVSGHAWACVI